MLYCSNCQVLITDDDRCPSCGSRKLRNVRQNDPVLLMTAGESECSRITAAFDDAGISHEKRMSGTGSPLSQLYGRFPYASYRIFVPFGELEHCRGILQDIGVLNDAGKKISPRQLQMENEDEKPSLSPAMRTVVRVCSIIAFILIITSAVFMADSLVNYFKTAFHLS